MATVVDPDRPVRIDRYLEGVEVDVDAVSDGDDVLIPGLLEHVERAGVHSGDSVGVFPPQTVCAGRPDLIVATMERIVLALGVRGLVNAQFIVRDDGVYLIEVNPRASRTVPFLSKVTGVPMVELAVRIALGETLPRAGLAGRPAARRRRSSRSRRRPSRRPSCAASIRRSGPGCSRPARSSASTRTRGSRWPRRSSGPRSCRRGRVRTGALALLSIADRDKALLRPAGRGLARAGYRLAATAGTRAALAAASGTTPRPVAKLGAADEAEGRSRSSSSSPSGEVRLVVNTPTPQSGAVRDAAEIRLAATAEGILCLDGDRDRRRRRRGARPRVVDRLAEVRPLGEWVPEPRSLAGVADRRRG